MKTQHKKFIISLLIGTSFSVFGANGDDDAASMHIQTNTALHNSAVQPIMTKEQFVGYFAGIPPTIKGVTTEESRAILANIPDSQWSNFIYMRDRLQLTNGDSGAAIFAIARNVPAEQWAELIDVCEKITPFVYQNHKQDVVTIVAKTPATQWADLSDIFLAVVANGMNIVSRGKTLWRLSKIPANQYNAILGYYTLIKSIPSIDANTNSDLIVALLGSEAFTALGKIPVNQLLEFFYDIKSTTRYMNTSCVERSIMSLGAVPAEYWRNITDICHMITKTNPNLSPNDRAYIQSYIMKLNPSLYLYFQQFMHNNPNFFRYVGCYDFAKGMHQVTTQESLQTVLTELHNEYYHRAPRGIPQTLVFENSNSAVDANATSKASTSAFSRNNN